MLPRDLVADARPVLLDVHTRMCVGGETSYNGKIGLDALTDVNDNDWLIDDALPCLGGPADY